MDLTTLTTTDLRSERALAVYEQGGFGPGDRGFYRVAAWLERIDAELVRRGCANG